MHTNFKIDAKIRNAFPAFVSFAANRKVSSENWKASYENGRFFQRAMTLYIPKASYENLKVLPKNTGFVCNSNYLRFRSMVQLRLQIFQSFV